MTGLLRAKQFVELATDWAILPVEDTDCDSLAAWPEVGSRMMTRILTGADTRNGWVVVQDGVHRYTVMQCGQLTVKSVLFEYLPTEVRWDS